MVAAVDLLGPQPADAILEVGGGSGVSAALICGRLGSGRLVALDRSSVAGRRNAKRNTDHLAAGRLEIRDRSSGATLSPTAGSRS